MFRRTLLRNAGPLLSREPKSPSRKSCFASTTRHAEASKSSPEPRPLRSALLGNRSAGLVGLEAVPSHSNARDCRPLAPVLFLYLLAPNFQSPEAGWKETD